MIILIYYWIGCKRQLYCNGPFIMNNTLLHVQYQSHHDIYHIIYIDRRHHITFVFSLNNMNMLNKVRCLKGRYRYAAMQFPSHRYLKGCQQQKMEAATRQTTVLMILPLSSCLVCLSCLSLNSFMTHSRSITHIRGVLLWRISYGMRLYRTYECVCERVWLLRVWF